MAVRRGRVGAAFVFNDHQPEYPLTAADVPGRIQVSDHLTPRPHPGGYCRCLAFGPLAFDDYEQCGGFEASVRLRSSLEDIPFSERGGRLKKAKRFLYGLGVTRDEAFALRTDGWTTPEGLGCWSTCVGNQPPEQGFGRIETPLVLTPPTRMARKESRRRDLVKSSGRTRAEV